jgi:2-polyprenyl-3-methyl-5-hydroxy-6-metoxy-1,4-benzoquinol methylase
MSILTGKQGYESVAEFVTRTEQELKNRSGSLFLRDTQPPAHEVAYVRESLQGRQSVLEIGCGFGIWSRVARAVGCTKYVGVDPVPERIRYAREQHNTVGVWFEVSDARTLRLEDRFDTVLSVTVLQHLTLPDAIAALVTLNHHLLPGGKGILLESRLWDISFAEAEMRYAGDDCAAHMIPKPLKTLQEAIPSLSWERAGVQEDRFHLTKVSQ